MAVNPDDKSLALFCDFENIALGVRDTKYKKFNIQHVLERLLVKGSIVVKKAYCDWDRYKEFKAPMHEAAFELIEIPHVRMSGKNSADIRLVVDALDLCYTKAHVDTFVIISGDSDFSPLVSKLRENAKTVIGVGVKNSTSDLLINSCDEFIYYDDLVRELERKESSGGRSGRKRSGGRGGRSRRNENETPAEQAANGSEAAQGAVADTGADAAADAGAPARELVAAREGTASGTGADRSAPDRADTDGAGTDGAGARDTSAPRDAPRDAPSGRRSRPAPRGADTAGAARTVPVRNGAAPVQDDDEEIGVVFFAVPDDDDEVETVAAGSPVDGDHGNRVEEATDGGDEDATEDDLQQEGIDLMIETAAALSTERGGKDRLWGSMIKQALKRRRPGFNESYYGFDSFSKMLEEAEAQGLLKLEPDDRSGGYIIRDVSG